MSSMKVEQAEKPAKLRIEIDGEAEFDLQSVMCDLGLEINGFATRCGLLIMEELMRLETEQLAGHRYQRQTEVDRWGSQPGYVRLGGQKVHLKRPRLRHRTGKHEVPLKTYSVFQDDRQNASAIFERLIGGLSSRRYQNSVEAVSEGYGLTRSTISRQMIQQTSAKVRELCDRDLSGFDVRVLLIDGVRVGRTMQVVVLGIDSGGNKQILGFREGATENAGVVKQLLAELIERGLPLGDDRRILVVLDGSKALSAAINELFASRASIQRCQVHKLRNVLDHLPEKHRREYKRKIQAGWAMTTYQDAKAALISVVNDLNRINCSAAKSLQEGLEETLTLHQLGLPEELRTSLNSTNMIESAFSCSRHLMKNVRNWQSSDQVQRWTAAVLLESERKFHRMQGHAKLPALLTALSNTIQNSNQ